MIDLFVPCHFDSRSNEVKFLLENIWWVAQSMVQREVSVDTVVSGCHKGKGIHWSAKLSPVSERELCLMVIVCYAQSKTLNF